MSWGEMFEQGPQVFIPAMLISLALTLLAYGSFPLILAKARKAPISVKKYKRYCYGFNAIVMVVLGFLGGGAISIGPYFLWTWIFSNSGVKILEEKGLAFGFDTRTSEEPPVETIEILFCRKCGAKLIEGAKFCRECGTEVIGNSIEVVNKYKNLELCKKCGADITNDVDACHVCGERKVNI